MTILLTGASGFIGSNFHQHFKDKYNIICIDRTSGQDLLTCELPEADVIIHLAGLSGVRDSLENPTEYWKQNVLVTKRLFDRYGPRKRILYASSSTAYEPWRNPYAFSKYAMEEIAPPNSLGMRFTTVYGPGARENMLIPKILRNDVQYINVNHTRDFIHVDDLIAAINLLIDKRQINGIIDIGTGITHKLTDILNHFGIEVPNTMGDESERLDNKAYIGLLEKYGWKPHINLYKYIQMNRIIN